MLRRLLIPLLFLFTLLWVGGVGVVPAPAHAAADLSPENLVGLEHFLDQEGRLSVPTGFTGAIDPAGYQLAGSANAPRFVRVPESPTAGLDDANWDPRFGSVGTNGLVRAVVWDGSNLYIAGTFNTVFGVSANQVARWNGSSWSALGAGMNNTGSVLALAWDGSNLYAGGTFTSPASRVARWNGSAWSALAGGANNTVHALTWGGGNLYAGGDFTSPATRVARWDGSAWNALGTGIGGSVRALTWNGTDLYAGGAFTSPATRVARWDGASWNALGTGVDGTVFALAWDGTDLYVGGSFSNAGGSPASRIARWDGSAWNTLTSGVDSTVRALVWSGTNLYVGGQFTTAGGSSANRVARWDGSAWSTLGSGANGNVWGLAWDSASLYNSLYAGGDFTVAGVNPSAQAARWRIAAIWDGGGVNSNASTAANWSGDSVPLATDVAIFDSTSSNNATLDAAFTPTLGSMVIEDSYGGTVNHAINLAITNNLNVYSATLVVADPSVNTLTVGGSVNHTGGTIQQTRPVNAADVPFLEIDDGAAAVKYRGVEVNTVTSGANLGNVTVTVRAVDNSASEYCTTQGASSPAYAARCYQITATTDGAANVQLWALTSELNGIAEANLGVYRGTAGVGTWTLLGNRTTGNDGGSYSFATGDTPGFSFFLLGNATQAPTAVTLQTFTTSPALIPAAFVVAFLFLAGISTVLLVRRRH